MILEMDTEYSNDESETWEDFFGSSLELGSSFLHLCNLPTTARKPFKNLNVLSPNVQRILAHSKCNTDTSTSKYSQTQCYAKNAVNKRKVRGHNNFPLSGVASKISQSSADLQIQSDSDTIDIGKNVRYIPRHTMAENQVVAQNTSTKDTSLTSISDSNNSQTSSPISRELKPGNLRFMRPLSTSSTDSSSSSTSTNNNRAGSQYLASIESLADHSDPDQTYENRTTLSIGERVCLEVIHTEENYIGDLKQVKEGYLESWRKNSHLDDKSLETLFCNIQDIYKFNSLLLQKLNLTENDPVKIAKCFIECNDGFEVYTKYCTNYPHAIALLTELLQAKDTSSLLRETQSMLGHKLPLGSYILKPVQRIMKYHLLLQNLHKHHENGYIERATQMMTDVAHHIDEVKRHMEQQSRVQELEGSLDGWLGPSLTVLGELCLEGTLQERNHKSRQVFLFEKMLLITKRKEDGRLAYKSHIMCSNLMLVESIQGEPTSFHVIPYDSPKNQCTLQARSVQQKKQWSLQLKRLMLDQFKGRIPARAQVLVLGIDADEGDNVPGSKRDSRKIHSTPEYLERRHERRRSEMSMRRLNKNRKLTLDFSSITSNDVSSINSVNKSATEEKKYSSWYLDEETEKNLPYEQKSYSNDHLDSVHMPNLEVKSTTKSECKMDVNRGKSFDTERCRSEPRIPSDLVTHIKENAKTEQNRSSHFFCDTLVTDASPKYLKPPIRSFEIKQYNTKTLPKKITKIKKSRTKSVKTGYLNSNSKFYADLLSDDTSLPKVGSTDDTQQSMKSECIQTNMKRSKSAETEKISQALFFDKSQNMEHLDLSIKSSSSNNVSINTNNVEPQSDEHIYETLKVDSEVSFCNDDEGESDYVVLDDLKAQIEVKQDNLNKFASELQVLFLEKLQTDFESEGQTSSPVPYENTIVTSNNEIPSATNSNSFLQRIRSFREESQSRRGSLDTSQRKTVLEASPNPAIYKQNSDRLGYRFANIDYADPKLLFKDRKLYNVPNVNNCDIQVTNSKENKIRVTSHVVNSCAISVEANQENDFYEKSVEDSLESDFFRDSAIYSDDNRCSKADVDSKHESDQDSLPFKVVQSDKLLPVNSNRNHTVGTGFSEGNTQTQSENEMRAKYSDGWVKKVVDKFQ